MNNTRTLLCLFLCATSSAITANAAGIKTDVSAGLAYDDNVTRAKLDRDIETDSILHLEANLAYKQAISDNSYFTLRGSLDATRYLDFSKLSGIYPGVHAAIHYRPFSGFTASRFFLSAAYTERMIQSDQRDGSATELELGFSKRLTDVVTLRAGYIKQTISAGSSVFDADNDRYYLDAELRSSNNALYMTLGYIDGHVVSTTVPTQEIIDASDGIVRDDAFLDLTPNRWAYRLTAQTTTFTLGDSYSFASNQGVDASVLYYDSKAYGNNNYKGLIYRVNYRYRF